MELYDIIRAAGAGAIVEELAKDAGVARDQAEEALRTLLPEFGRAIRRAGESRSGAPAVHAAMQDERYARYLEQPGALREAAAAGCDACHGRHRSAPARAVAGDPLVRHPAR